MKNTRTKKRNFKTRLIAAALSVITVFSVGTMTLSTATVTASAATAEETGKKIGIDAADAAFDAIGDLFPGVNILVSPFKSLFHSGVDDKDPMEIIDEKLDKIDSKLDVLDDKVNELNENINKNTAWMAQKVQNTADMSELRGEFKGLSPQLVKFVKDVKAIETNKDLSKSQKIMRLAALTDTIRYDNITTYVYNISKSMDGTDPAYVDMFKALYTKEAINSMFAREAYRAALPTAEALITQYVSAAALMQECQTAVKAVSQFTEENINELNTAYDANLYNNFNQYRHSMDDDDAAIALVAAANGVNNFQTKYDRPVYINKNADTAGREVRLDYDQGRRCVWNKDRSDYLDVEGKVKENVLTIKELTAIADHVRTKFPARSMYEYLITDMRINANVTGDCYIILSDEVNISKTRNTKIDKSFNDGIYKCCGYDRVGTVKAIRMGDRNKAVVDLKLFTYQQWDDEFMKSILGTYYAVGLSNSTLFKVKMVRVFNA